MEHIMLVDLWLALLQREKLNNHCPDLSAQCDVCSKRFTYEDNFKIHIMSCHQLHKDQENAHEQTNEKEIHPPLSTSKDNTDNHGSVKHSTPRIICDSCDKYFESNEQLQEHTKEHERDNALNTCQECNVLVKDNELSILCVNCHFCYHKKCTSLKKSSGHWKPHDWNCHFCQNSNPQNPSVEIEITDKRKNPPKPGGKHRKSNVTSCEHPDKEFLESQINTLKTIVAKREAELKKIQESDNLKAKRIMNLEAQLNESRKAACQANGIANDNQNVTENTKIADLEVKTNNLENQVTFLFNQLENMNKANDASPTSQDERRVYSCDLCDLEFNEKEILKKHKETSHRTICNCDVCPFTTDDTTVLDLHKRTHTQLLTCPSCEYRTKNENEMDEHRMQEHMKCNDCSYHAINHKDLRRHKSSMHPKIIRCDLCSYETRSESDLRRHKNTMHPQQPFYCDVCPHETKTECELKTHKETNHIENSHEELGNHTSRAHRQRTRIFSSSRRPSLSTNSVRNSDQDIFRPWSAAATNTSSTITSSSRTPEISVTIPQPFTSRTTQIPDGFLNKPQHSKND